MAISDSQIIKFIDIMIDFINKNINDSRIVITNEPIRGICRLYELLIDDDNLQHSFIKYLFSYINILNCPLNYWFPINDFTIRLAFLNHVRCMILSKKNDKFDALAYYNKLDDNHPSKHFLGFDRYYSRLTINK